MLTYSTLQYFALALSSAMLTYTAAPSPAVSVRHAHIYRSSRLLVLLLLPAMSLYLLPPLMLPSPCYIPLCCSPCTPCSNLPLVFYYTASRLLVAFVCSHKPHIYGCPPHSQVAFSLSCWTYSTPDLLVDQFFCPSCSHILSPPHL
jgi:hypothetical protein